MATVHAGTAKEAAAAVPAATRNVSGLAGTAGRNPCFIP